MRFYCETGNGVFGKALNWSAFRCRLMVCSTIIECQRRIDAQRKYTKILCNIEQLLCSIQTAFCLLFQHIHTTVFVYLILSVVICFCKAHMSIDYDVWRSFMSCWVKNRSLNGFNNDNSALPITIIFDRFLFY